MGKKRKGFRRRSKSAPATVSESRQANRSSKHKQWTEKQMLATMETARSGLSANRAAEVHGVPRSTLKDRLSG